MKKNHDAEVLDLMKQAADRVEFVARDGDGMWQAQLVPGLSNEDGCSLLFGSDLYGLLQDVMAATPDQ